MSATKRSKPADSIGIIGALLSILVVVFPVTYRLQIVLLAIAAAVVVYYAFNSAWTIHLHDSLKQAIAIIAVVGLIAIGWSPVRLEYQKDQPPDAFPIFVNPKEPTIVLTNKSANVARDIKWGVVVWNLDVPDANQNPLQIPFQIFDFLRAHQSSAPEQLFTPVILSQVKPGNRLFGYATVECPECATSRDAWVYVEYGKSGWFAPLRTGEGVDMQHLGKAIPQIEKNISASIDSLVPPNQRIQIKGID